MSLLARRWHYTAIGIVVVGIFMFPVYWLAATSLKAPTELFTQPPKWFPSSFYIKNYTEAFANPQMLHSFVNSVEISLGTTALTVVLSAPAAYALARLRLRWSSVLLLPFLIAQLLPTINVALPLFFLFSGAGLTDSIYGLILGDTVLTMPFAVIILRPFYLNIPMELEEAGRVDGCNRAQAFVRIILPLARPGLVTVMAFSFVMTWGEFTLGLTLNPRTVAQPITVALNSFVGQYATQWGPLMAASVIVAVPIVIVFVSLQRFITSGLTAGSVKD